MTHRECPTCGLRPEPDAIYCSTCGGYLERAVRDCWREPSRSRARVLLQLRIALARGSTRTRSRRSRLALEALQARSAIRIGTTVAATHSSAASPNPMTISTGSAVPPNVCAAQVASTPVAPRA